MDNISNRDKAFILNQALPYIQKYTEKTVVIKYGGSAMENPELKKKVMSDVALLSTVGINVIVVHGGGKDITSMLNKIGKESKFINGFRYTDSETAEIVNMVLSGKVNKELVASLENCGGKCLGICGIDGKMFKVSKYKSDDDLGFVGDIDNVNTDLLNTIISNKYIPIVATVGCDDEGNIYNINADTAAAKIAESMKAETLIYMTDTPGLLKNKDDENSLISQINIKDINNLIKDGTISGGMIPKVKHCIDAVENGVSKVFIIDGRLYHSLLIEMFTDEGIGTMFYKD
ncbi:acetylglutamate kinase [Brachyspira hampsonii]|uniref:Acetylglutamate kinase n=1 Tax=Brachyspira hampsonii TaxID=1287055 RepID=A0AAC9XJ12_9SPIR|nr:acetylglutamate kinase [Brachyspira hampsonii]ASJ20232.1 acetylglutamate kinase [Brachyspira hampsonii]ELV06232.1 acetylglutamate kinase [Brachyspira hampsonii 30599]MBW5380482.1 acetylglutamate kinase [Brachyspira hampsonii]MBW5409286.1 acetylglutamate kinase [Brachyspira hampsonii]OEJ17059.1 acetylglutamate kinase [Brachyspira hampsonii]